MLETPLGEVVGDVAVEAEVVEAGAPVRGAIPDLPDLVEVVGGDAAAEDAPVGALDRRHAVVGTQLRAVRREQRAADEQRVHDVALALVPEDLQDAVLVPTHLVDGVARVAEAADVGEAGPRLIVDVGVVEDLLVEAHHRGLGHRGHRVDEVTVLRQLTEGAAVPARQEIDDAADRAVRVREGGDGRVGHVGPAMRRRDGGDAGDTVSVVEAVRAHEVAAVDATLRKAHEIDSLRAGIGQQRVHLLGEVARAHVGAVEGRRAAEHDLVTVRGEGDVDVVEAPEVRGARVEAMREEDREGGRLSLRLRAERGERRVAPAERIPEATEEPVRLAARRAIAARALQLVEQGAGSLGLLRVALGAEGRLDRGRDTRLDLARGQLAPGRLAGRGRAAAHQERSSEEAHRERGSEEQGGASAGVTSSCERWRGGVRGSVIPVHECLLGPSVARPRCARSDPRCQNHGPIAPDAASSLAAGAARRTLSRMPKPGDVLAGRFHISRQIGQGGLAQVFEAEQLDLGRRVVIKTLRQPFAKDPVLLTRFRREARAAACIHHPNVTSVSALYEPPGEPPFLVMDLVDGETLHDAFRVSGPMDAQRLIPILMQLLDGLAAAHARGIVHRDLKPRNVMLTRTASIEDFVHIVDFGVAAVLHPTDGPLTVRGEMIGTPGYMAP
ncbi:MAG TPA: hypothetical protein DEF51_02530, partial [Myxococcales bacterium]|nr:hypothetical protein [Myxococcales bacterium]